VYEGIEQEGNRRYCKNIFHVSEYGMPADALWEKVLDEIDRRYDLEGTKIYLHGDGASWIETGKTWLPNCGFVLDKYHRNRSIKAMCIGINDSELRCGVEAGIRESLLQGNKRVFHDITYGLSSAMPEYTKQIHAAARYLRNHIEGIHICRTDAESNNGGCSEPHVSHILSSRLSDRPRTWSEKTLKNIAPILAKRGKLEVKKKQNILIRPCSKELLLKRKEHLNLNTYWVQLLQMLWGH
jgi:hypothetical protein